MTELTVLKYKGKEYWGFKKCPSWLKLKYIQAVNGICQDCKKKKPLEPHRIKRGVEGGLYTVLPLNHPMSNVKIICHDCHEKYNHSRRCPY
jgi:hypothetical protein